MNLLARPINRIRTGGYQLVGYSRSPQSAAKAGSSFWVLFSLDSKHQFA